MTPYREGAPKLLANGWLPIPIDPKTESPSIDNWRRLNARDITPELIERHSEDWVAIACGHKNIVGIRFDNIEFYEKCSSIIGSAPTVLDHDGRATAIMRSKDAVFLRKHRKLGFEVLGKGEYVIIP
jgi:hypothetical protein